MPYEQSWLIEHEAAHIKLIGDVTAEDIEASVMEMVQRLDNSNRHLVHMLVDMREVTSHPTKVKVISQASKVVLSHPRLGWILFYGNLNQFTRFLAGVVMQLARTRCRFLDTPAEAVEFLQRVDQSLKPLPELL